jgi:hypothetical protein
MRIKGALGGDGGNFDCSNLFYLSIHTLDSQQGIQYAKSRVAREILDAWLAKKISFDGKKYDDSEISLSDQDESEGPCCRNFEANQNASVPRFVSIPASLELLCSDLRCCRQWYFHSPPAR